MSLNKRQFLQATGAGLGCAFTAGLAGMAALAGQSAHASGSDYRALVCLFMNGGNDSHNWFVPVDSDNHPEYASARSTLAMRTADLLSLGQPATQPTGLSLGVPSALQPLQRLYTQRRLAVIANVGAIQQPVTKADYLAGRNMPPKLFSHNDQQSWWQSFEPEGARTGWGGRMADALLASNQHPIFTSVSTTGRSVLLAGVSGPAYQISTSGAVGIQALHAGSTFGSSTLAQVMRRSQFDAGQHVLQSAYAQTTRRATDAYALLAQAVSQTPTRPLSHEDGSSLEASQLARQLRAVVQMIGAHQSLGMRRQVFMVSLGGFDTHSNQAHEQTRLMQEVARGVAWFQTALQDLGLQDKVTLFSASEFGRTLVANGSGTDHGWGAHHFVVGGAVRGGDVYGRFPTLALGGPNEVEGGRLVPTTSVIEYGAALARWMGLSATEASLVFPNLGRFEQHQLQFI
jgi:uncharacterized protein (DUF1501 family)